MLWTRANRADPHCRQLADRHYNRQKPGTPQFVPPGRCVVLSHPTAVWVTSYPYAQYVKHAWAGAWVNSLFRKEGPGLASAYILDAVRATRFIWPEVPELGLITFVDPHKVPGVRRREKDIFGYCYHQAGFTHVGFTKKGLWAWQLLPADMPPAEAPAPGG